MQTWKNAGDDESVSVTGLFIEGGAAVCARYMKDHPAEWVYVTDEEDKGTA